ncbi:MAG: hypothetical protein HOP34_12590 [Methylococcaceae bacterium]|nr:hypothetical protein [Methylococcaceae bacterium]
MDDYQATLYPDTEAHPTVTYADPLRKDIGICLSGGGSRALTCAWGQLIGLRTLKDPQGHPLLDQVRYISSVSGGSWAAVLYTYRPKDYSDDAFFGNSYAPDQLYYNQDHANGLNVSKMGASALGKIPQNFANLFELDPIKNIIADFITITLLKGIPIKTSGKWLWSYIVGKNVLADFGLYTFKNSLFNFHETPWSYKDAKFFSLSPAYADSHIFVKAKAPSKSSFVYARTDASGKSTTPMLIINTNIAAKDCPGRNMSAPMQIPTQVSAVSAGIYGSNPCTADRVGGGSVDTFAYTSQLSSLSGAAQVTAEFARAYTLTDITACSSAFYASTLIELMRKIVAKMMQHNDSQLHAHFLQFISHAENLVMGDMHKKLSEMDDDLKSLDIAYLVPQYNDWQVGQVSKGPLANQNTEFTDGGNLENSGVAGLLAQVQGTIGNIIAFINGSEVLEQKQGVVIAATQVAPLFGVAYDDKHEEFKNYLPNGVNPFTGQTDPTGFLQVFANEHGEFNALRQGLYTSNGAGAKTNPAFCRQTLQVVKNTLLGITQTRSVNLLWVQNAQVNNWQNQISDPVLRLKIKTGQTIGFLDEFADFPYYSTFLKIHQTAAETNTLAQMWAWCVSHKDSPLSTAINQFFAAA